jgi:hypothetical protein
MVWSLQSAALAVSSSPNTQLILSRLVMQPRACGSLWGYAWPYVLSVNGELTGKIPYFGSQWSLISQGRGRSSASGTLTDIP